MKETPTKSIIRVAIQRPIYTLLDYQCNSNPLPKSGYRVRVPLGNSNVVGIIVETDVKSEVPNLKSVMEVIDQQSLFSDSMFDLLKWASQYYFYPLGEVLFHALPVLLRKGKSYPKIQLWKANIRGKTLEEGQLNRSPKQKQMLALLIKEEVDAQQLRQSFGTNWRNILKQLDVKEYITQREINADNNIINRTQIDTALKQKITLTDEQQSSVASIADYFKENHPKPIMLHGITGSGKTEVYLRAIESLLESGKQVLVLVPEIGLTPQLLTRFQEHFPESNTASLHSALAAGDRLRVWMGARSGSINIIIGTRSAVFTPMKSLGAIIVDEEHDASFKQQEGFLYQGRDLAIKRAYDEAIPIVLGSATPSLESLHNSKNNRYHYLRISSRPGTRKPPTISLQDIRSLSLEAGISSLMMSEIHSHINNQQQVMLFLNRRGFAPILMCPDCGWHASCTNCDIGMTYHASISKVICHHCGVQNLVKQHCPDCNKTNLTTQGHGTERIEEVLNTHFPDIPVIRIDRDSTSKKGSLEKKLKMVHEGKPIILIGTQMLTKGHDFPNLTLVGILDVDQALFSMDFRSQERLTQQVLQVSGRAGRGEKKGQVILQTSQPQHPILLSLLSQGYLKTAEHILDERELWNYPPSGAQALVRVSAETEKAGINFLNKLREQLPIEDDNNVSILGPMPSPMLKRANRYRFQILFSAQKRGHLHNAIKNALALLAKLRRTGGVRWTIDIDPVDFL
ncbi:MAG: primosomal protein N' [Cocleimonas sp.]